MLGDTVRSLTTVDAHVRRELTLADAHLVDLTRDHDVRPTCEEFRAG